jgi:hypothetical protein
MANLTLAPEDDDRDFPRDHNFGPSPRDGMSDLELRTELKKYHEQFNPHKVGFGLLPWPGVDPSGRKDKIAIAMQYLMDGTILNEGDKK